jgi:histidinol-phosphate aminotransferase
MAERAFLCRPRPGVLESRPYEPGRSLDDLPEDIRRRSRAVKLASNENPLGPSPRVARALAAVGPDLARYPDPAGRRLRAAIADRLGVPSEGVVLAGGSDQLLVWLAQVFLDRDRAAVVSTYTFPTYRLAAHGVGAPLAVAPSRSEDDERPFAHDPQALAARAAQGAGIVFLDNPCNPVGSVLERASVADLLASLPADVLLVVDEAYIDYVPEPERVSAVPLLSRHPNLVVTRTFSKIYGLAGLRLGFGLMHPEASALVARVRLPFAVSTLALAGGEAAWADWNHYELSRRHVLEERPRLAADLVRRGWRVLPSATNFLTARPPLPAARVFDELFREGIIVRPLRDPGLDGYLRITIGTREEDDLLLAALDRFMLPAKGTAS